MGLTTRCSGFWRKIEGKIGQKMADFGPDFGRFAKFPEKEQDSRGILFI